MISYSICLSLTFSPSIIYSRSIHLAANGNISLFLKLSVCVCVYTYHIFLSRLSVDGHLGGFHVLTVVNSAAMNIGVRVSFQMRIFIIFQIYTQEWDCWIIW